MGRRFAGHTLLLFRFLDAIRVQNVFELWPNGLICGSLPAQLPRRKKRSESGEPIWPRRPVSGERCSILLFNRMPIQTRAATTHRDRPARLADGLELERALVRDHWTPALFSTTRREQLAGVHAGSKPSPQRCLANEPPRLGPPLPCVARDSATSSDMIDGKKKSLARSQPRATGLPHNAAKTCDAVRQKAGTS